MRILLWSQYFWPENFRINELAKALCQEGVEITVLTGKPNYPGGGIFPGYELMGIAHEEYSGIEVIRVPLIPRGDASSKRLMLNYLSFIFSGLFVAPYALRGRSFDAVFVYAPSPLLQALPAIFMAWVKRAPLIIWVQDLWPDALRSTGHVKNRFLLWCIELAVRYVYRLSDSILIQSEGFRRSVESLANCNEKIRFYPNPAEDILFKAAEGGLDSDLAKAVGTKFSLVFAGNIGTAQSCETIVAAANLLQDVPNIQFYLVGDGSMADVIAKSITLYGLSNVVMTGRVSADTMSSIYSTASALLLTLRDDAGLSATIPSKLQSYLAAGKPIIVSSYGESADVVRKANAGLTCPAENAEALAEAVLELYKMRPEERACLGGNGRKYFLEHYSLSDRAAELAAHLKAVAAHHKKHGN